MQHQHTPTRTCDSENLEEGEAKNRGEQGGGHHATRRDPPLPLNTAYVLEGYSIERLHFVGFKRNLDVATAWTLSPLLPKAAPTSLPDAASRSR
ncbi:hypothetical protein GUJ93_ZPchr0008g11892 [Zizania palustris]|uniref:Uncharacterized protein n=1 Tax=Zizania palustris TaxID=103762 RepID=A0A8J5RGF6_ZIZPA|nr:hypothetical protein GUJ93_ZPchr0008g11892 [Zizania palustris]